MKNNFIFFICLILFFITIFSITICFFLYKKKNIYEQFSNPSMYEIGDLILKHYTSNSFADNARKNNIVITYYYTNSNILTDEKNTTNKYNIFKNLNNIHSELTKSIAEQPPKNANDKPNITNDALRILKNITLSLDKSNNDNEYIKISLKPIDIII